MPGIAELQDRNKSYKSLQSASAANSTGMVWYRADYELHWLRKSRKECVKIGRLMKRCRTFKGYAELSRALLEWCERERILLRIPLPASVKAPEPRRVSGSTVNYTELPASEPAVMYEAGASDGVPVPNAQPLPPQAS
jgi:hypothetical protein